MLYASEENTQKAGMAIKRSMLSFVGFIAWFQTLIDLEDTTLHEEDKAYVRALPLNDHPKTGVLYSMSRDFHEANFPHLLLHWVSIRRLDKRGEGELAISSLEPGSLGRIHSYLPSGAAWKNDGERSDWYFQNKAAGKRGKAVTGFLPTWDYSIVDFHLWGARPLTDRNHIRAYAKRFKATVTTTDRMTICTFFRQNPLQRDEPPFDRDFSTLPGDERTRESDVFHEKMEVVREQHKDIHAPRPTHPFNSFNGAREIVPLDKSLRGNTGKAQAVRRGRDKREVPKSSLMSSYGEAWSSSPLKERLGPITQTLDTCDARSGAPGSPGFASTWARKMAGERCRSSCSTSLRRGPAVISRRRSQLLVSECTLDTDKEGGNFADEYAAVSASEGGESNRVPEVVERSSGDHPFSGPSPIHTWDPGFQTEEQAREAIESWAPAVIELTPIYGTYPRLTWNQEWLSCAILICDDNRSYWRLKVYTVVFKGFTKFEELLELAIRLALPFAVYIPRNEVHRFSVPNVSSLDLKTLGALYTPGYVDHLLVWTGLSGGPAIYGQYEGRMGSLLRRPEAVAFVPLGGVCRFVAEVYNGNIIYCYVQGPSLQSRRIDRHGTSSFYTTDRISNSEIYLLLGHIAGASSSADCMLWPTPEVFECESLHMRGYLSEGSYRILSNLRCDIIELKRYKWCTYSQWKEYFCVGAKGDHEPKSVPGVEDFEAGAKLIGQVFPINWLDMDLKDIVLPEEFKPLAQRD
ncbi:hypothetical protein B0H13DRAFT_1913431 [Mycena leptocephala]|nr:hypothetical protein B0H13DRAFT_1913431 [Mycena leptocephala]